MIDCKVASTPIETTPTRSTPSIDVLSDPTPYRSLVNALQYSTFTQPDITFVFNRVYQFMHKPSSTHFVVAKCILQYLKGTLDKGVLFQLGPLALTAFIDVAWTSDLSDRRSTFDIVVFFFVIILLHGTLERNTPFPTLQLKSNIILLRLVLLNLPGFIKSFVILDCIYLPLL